MGQISEFFSNEEKHVDHTIVLTAAAFAVHSFAFLWGVIHDFHDVGLSSYAQNAMYIAGGGGLVKGAKEALSALANTMKPSSQQQGTSQ